MSRCPPNVQPLTMGMKYWVKLGYVSKAGQLFMVLDPDYTEDIDKKRQLWSNTYLNEPIRSLEGLKFHVTPSAPLRRAMVVSVNRAAGTVVRGILSRLDMDKRKALLDCVDLGEMKEFPIDSLYEATRDVIDTKWKTIACLLNGLKMFVGTPFMQRALDEVSFIQKSVYLRMEVTGVVDSHYVIDLECMSSHKQPKNINDMMLAFIGMEFNKGFRENFKGSVTNLTESGMVTLTQAAGSGEGTVLETFERFLARVNRDFEKLRRHHPTCSKATVDMGEVYLAKFVDNELYRAKVLEVDKAKDTVEVEYIDYGNVETVRCEALLLAKLVDKTLANMPPLCKKAFLKWVGDIVDYDKVYDLLSSKEWTVTQRKMVRDGQPLVCLVDPANGAIVNKTVVLERWATKASSS